MEREKGMKRFLKVNIFTWKCTIPWWGVQSILLWCHCLFSSKSLGVRWPQQGCIWSWTCQTDETFVFPERIIRERRWISFTDNHITISITIWLWLYSDNTARGLSMQNDITPYEINKWATSIIATVCQQLQVGGTCALALYELANKFTVGNDRRIITQLLKQYTNKYSVSVWKLTWYYIDQMIWHF